MQSFLQHLVSRPRPRKEDNQPISKTSVLFGLEFSVNLTLDLTLDLSSALVSDYPTWQLQGQTVEIPQNHKSLRIICNLSFLNYI